MCDTLISFEIIIIEFGSDGLIVLQNIISGRYIVMRPQVLRLCSELLDHHSVHYPLPKYGCWHISDG